MKDVLVFGCGVYFMWKKETINKLYNVVAIVDNYKKGTVPLNDEKCVDIYTVKEGLSRYPDAAIVIAVENFFMPLNQLKNLGIPNEKIIFAQNMEPYGGEGIIFNENRKIYLEDNIFCYKKGMDRIKFKDQEEFNIICHKEEQEYKKGIFKASYDEIEKMNLKIPKAITPEVCPQNDYYGHAYNIKKYCDIDENYYIKAAIEHACYMGDDYAWDADINSKFNAIITLSPKRKEILERKTPKKVFMLGPYIAYADYSKSKKDLDLEKERLGRTLVVFPTHSTTHAKMDFDNDLFIKEIKELSKEFDSVRICVHYADILRNKHLMYKEAGFQVVSAGNMFDMMFLPRLKSILYCCDMIMANDVGSYIGQAAFLNKPCYLYRQKLDIYGTEIKEAIEEYSLRNKDKFYNELFEKFNVPQDYISNEQRDIINYGWGVDQVKNKAELKGIIGKIEEIWRNKIAKH